MAAVLCLMFLPLSFGCLFMVGSGGGLSVGTLLGVTTFLLLAGGLTFGAMRLSRQWEAERPD